MNPTTTSLKLKEEAADVKCTISMNDLSKLNERDSFLFYSIPEVHRAKMLEEDIDASQVGAWPQTVVRKSCISFECHPDYLMMWEEDGLLESDPEDDSEEFDDPLDILMARLY